MKLLIKIFFIFFLFKSILGNSEEYTQDIFKSSFIEFNEEDFKKIILHNNFDKLKVEDKILFIYTPGSMNDDRMDDICSTYNEFAYLSEFFYKLKKNFDYYFYLNCTNNI